MSKRRDRTIRIEGDLAFIPLTQGYVAVIDAADVPLIADHSWRAQPRPRTVYGHATIGPRDVALHRMIMDCSEGMFIDHADGDGLNNRRSNLRICTRAENQQNMRKLKLNAVAAKGVIASGERYMGRIASSGREYYLGTYDTIAEAKAAYLGAAKVLFGDFANPG